MGALVAATAAIIAFAWPAEREPVYHGQKLSEWLRIYRRPMHDRDNKLEARAAIQQIGTNAIPCLLKWIAARPPAWSRAVGRLHASWNPANRIINALQERSVQTADMRWTAAFGFEILGETASNAIPNLVRMLDSDDPQQHWPADMWPPSAYSLSRIGDAGLRPLLDWLSDPRSLKRNEAGVSTSVRALSSLQWSGANAALMTSIILNGLCSTNKNLALCSALGLSSMDPEPSVAVPALRKAARAGNGSTVRFYLRCLGPTRLAQPRVKEIVLQLQDDSDPAIQSEAKSALNRLAPETGITNRSAKAQE